MNPFPNFKELMADDTFQFTCQKCGVCCNNVNSTVMIESLDLFRLAKHLNMETSETAAEYAKVATLAWGAPILLLKTKTDDSCIFLKSNKCGIQSCKPRTCRLYPLTIGPDDSDDKNFIVLKSPERTFHYNGKEHIAGEWVKENMNDESYAYIITEYRFLRELGKIMRRIAREREDEVIEQMLLYRYLMFDTDGDFMKQYLRNMVLLKTKIEKLL